MSRRRIRLSDHLYILAAKDPRLVITKAGNVFRIFKNGLKQCSSPGSHRNGKVRYYRVWYRDRCLQKHVLIWTKFMGLPPKHKVVNHKDLNSLNNRLDNLELATEKQNVRHYHANRRK